MYDQSSRTWRVVLGDHDINKNEGREQYMSVSRVYIHPNWNSNNVAGGLVKNVVSHIYWGLKSEKLHIVTYYTALRFKKHFKNGLYVPLFN